MAENIFTLGSVGNFYNDHFVCLKIDAETGEGVELAKKYEVASFPTFVFVNPKSEKQDLLEVLQNIYGKFSQKDSVSLPYILMEAKQSDVWAYVTLE